MTFSTLVFASEDTKLFAPNVKRGDHYNATIQNNTNQTVTVTVSNQDGQFVTSPTYGVPAAGAVSIAAGAFDAITEPYATWLLTAGAAATGEVNITESG
jgi:hypothetical protein